MATAFDTYVISFGDRLSETDLTDRVQGFTTTAEVGLGELGTSSARVTLKNFDGAFIPAEGGGNGTYKDVDWRTQRLTIRVETYARDVLVFQGVITAISFDDNGVYSTVTLSARDWMQVATGEQATLTQGTQFSINNALNDALDGVNGWGAGVTLPEFGDSAATQNPVCFVYGIENKQVQRPAVSNVTAVDIIGNVLLPSGPFVHYVGEIGFQYVPTKFNNFTSFIVTSSLSKGLTTGQVVFNETPSGSSVASTELPIFELSTGFNDDAITNDTQITSLISGTTQQQAVNDDSIAKYGQRTRFYSSTANATNADASDVANFWTSRQGTPRYSPLKITTKLSMIEAFCGVNAYLQLSYLLSNQVLWSTATITATPTGGVSTTTGNVVYKRTVNATPSDTTITLELLPAQDYQSFVLDSDTFGVLDTNRLG